MIRQYHTGVNGWTSLKNNIHNIRIKDVVNKYFDELPARFDPSVAMQSFHVGSEPDETIYFHIMNNVCFRKDENCSRSEQQFKLWNFKKFWIWQVTCEYGENYGEETYFKQPKEEDEVVSKINIKELWNKGNQIKMYDEDAYGILRREVNYVGTTQRTSIVINMCQDTRLVEFVKDSKSDNVQENTSPKPVNICYTGRLKGKIEQRVIDKIVRKRLVKRRGPCGSEIHIDTYMGVVQIFGNNCNYRRITCKAFVSKRQADNVIEYLCRMVSSK
jgi:hypothetical protein